MNEDKVMKPEDYVKVLEDINENLIINGKTEESTKYRQALSYAIKAVEEFELMREDRDMLLEENTKLKQELANKDKEITTLQDKIIEGTGVISNLEKEIEELKRHIRELDGEDDCAIYCQELKLVNAELHALKNNCNLYTYNALRSKDEDDS